MVFSVKSKYPAKAIAGLLDGLHQDINTGLNYGENNVHLRAGVAVAKDTAAITATNGEHPLPVRALAAGDTAAAIYGAVVHAPESVDYAAAGAGHYAPGATVNVLKKGGVWMVCEGTPGPNDTVHVRLETGAGGTVIGAVRADADTNTALSMGARCEFDGEAEDGLILVRWRY